jgi:asparagine synthetase B (glutamine-hydrolysing)
MLATDLIDSLPGDMLAKVDLMSMANSLEVRVPLLDHRVVELAFQIPGPEKLRGGVTKRILKEAFKGLLPPGHTAATQVRLRGPHQPLAQDGSEFSGRPISL